MENRLIERGQSRDILAEIINRSADAVVSVDAEQNIVLVNDAFEGIFGYAKGEILGKSLNILLPEAVRSNHKELVAVYGKSSEISRYMGQRSDLTGITKSGKTIPLDISIQKHPEGGPTGYTAICRDISHRLDREKLLKENEAKFRTLFNTSHHLTILMNGEGEVMEFNDSVTQLLHAKPEGHIGKKIWDCEFWASETDFALVKESVSKIKPEKDITFIANALGEKNRKIVLEITVKTIWVEYKHSTWIVLEGKDITALLQSNKALVKSESRLARAQKIARLGNWEWTIATGELIWSDEVYSIFGLRLNEFDTVYEDFLELVHPDDRERVEKSVISALKGNHPYRVIHRIILPDETEKVIEQRGEVLRMDDGTAVRMDGTVQDITERWNREQELILAKRRAEEANIAKAQFLSAVSHELRTPLNAIIGFSTMIAEEQLGEIKNSYYRDYAVDINSSGKELLKLIQNILHVTSYELGAIKYNPCNFSAQTLLDKTMPPVFKRAAEKKVNIETSIDHNVPELYLDLEHMQRILGHLIDNAIKFSKENDTVKVNLYYKNNEFSIDVIDQGIGIDDSDVEKLFEHFVQKEMNLNRSYGGVGLGLTIVKNLAELQGGRVQVTSRVNQGSCFSVYFLKKDVEVALSAGIG